MRTRIVIADQGEARFYDTGGFAAPLQLAGRLTDPKAHLHDRDFKSDRPGRVFDHAPAATGRRGAVAHHGTGGERRPRKHEAALFARQIAGELERARREKKFDRIILMAGPPFLGVLRAALPDSLATTIVATVAKDLVHQAESVVRAHLPQQAFEALSGPREGA